MSNLAVSVALCTYNGARFLPEQLDSLANQTQLPTEVVVCDDGSTDASVATIEAFAHSAPFPVHLHVNRSNLGSTKNFEQAIQRCTGEVIALCDQDDVWAPEKLVRLSALLAERPEVGLVVTNAQLVDAGLGMLPVRLWDQLGFGPREQALVARGRALQVLVRRNFVTGATAAFRADFIPAIVPIPDCWVHDGWIALQFALRTEIAVLQKPLISYRQHGANQIGAPRPRTLSDVLGQPEAGPDETLTQEAGKWRVALERSISDRMPEADVVLLKAKLKHAEARAALPSARLSRIAPVARELVSGRYRRFSAGLGSALKDLTRR